MLAEATWIRAQHQIDDICPEFYTMVHIKKDIKSAQLYVSAYALLDSIQCKNAVPGI